MSGFIQEVTERLYEEESLPEMIYEERKDYLRWRDWQRRLARWEAERDLLLTKEVAEQGDVMEIPQPKYDLVLFYVAVGLGLLAWAMVLWVLCQFAFHAFGWFVLWLMGSGA